MTKAWGIVACAVMLLIATAALAEVAGTWDVEKRQTRQPGFQSVVLTFTPGEIDTTRTEFLGEEGNKVNDSLIFHSPPFSVDVPWTIVAGHMFYMPSYQDSVSTVDTIGYLLQAKMNDVGDSTWWTIGTCAKADEDQINNVPASADIKAYADADSVGLGDVFRVRLAIIAEEAQWRLEAGTANGGDAGIIPFDAIYRIYLMFAYKGNQ